MKFKIGDRVKHEKFREGTIIFDNGSGNISFIVEFDKPNHWLHSGDGKGKEDHCYWCSTSDLKLVSKSKQEVHIYVNDKVTTAILKENGTVLKKAEAKCNPSDEFNFETGVKLAFERLFINELNVGDNVKLIDFGEIYPTYEEWFKKTGNEKLESHFVKGKNPQHYVNYTVVAIGKHLRNDDIVLAIQNPNTTQVFLVGKEGVERIDK